MEKATDPPTQQKWKWFIPMHKMDKKNGEESEKCEMKFTHSVIER